MSAAREACPDRLRHNLMAARLDLLLELLYAGNALAPSDWSITVDDLALHAHLHNLEIASGCACLGNYGQYQSICSAAVFHRLDLAVLETDQKSSSSSSKNDRIAHVRDGLCTCSGNAHSLENISTTWCFHAGCTANPQSNLFRIREAE